MQEKMKMILQEGENFARIQQEYNDSSCKTIDLKSAFLQQVWPI